jgi:hypothetical protein
MSYNASEVIINEYLKELSPDIDISKFKEIFKLIDSNVLSKKEIKEICMKYNNHICDDKDCKKCEEGIHIFCELYKVGLLGYVNRDPTKKKKIFNFLKK